MEKKITKKDNFTLIKTLLADNKQIVDFCDHEIELLEKKNSRRSSDKPTKAQMANEVLKDSIVDEMEDNRLYSIGEMLKTMPCVAGLSSQKVSALVKQLKDEQRIERIEDGKKIFFKKM